MTRKDYVKIAQVLKDADKNATVETIGRELAAVCKADNPRFDEDRFFIAAGIPRNQKA